MEWQTVELLPVPDNSIGRYAHSFVPGADAEKMGRVSPMVGVETIRVRTTKRKPLLTSSISL